MGGVRVTNRRQRALRREAKKKKRYFWGDAVNGIIKKSKKIREEMKKLYEVDVGMTSLMKRKRMFLNGIKNKYNVGKDGIIRWGVFKGQPYYIPYFYLVAVKGAKEKNPKVEDLGDTLIVKIDYADRKLIPELTDYDKEIKIEVNPETKEYGSTGGYAILWINKTTKKIERERKKFATYEEAKKEALNMISRFGEPVKETILKLSEIKGGIEDPYETGGYGPEDEPEEKEKEEEVEEEPKEDEEEKEEKPEQKEDEFIAMLKRRRGQKDVLPAPKSPEIPEFYGSALGKSGGALGKLESKNYDIYVTNWNNFVERIPIKF